MAFLKNTFIFLSIVMMFYSCEIYNPKEDVPSYLKIDRITLIDNPQIYEGTLSNNIPDAWVYVDDNLIGAYEMPVKIPILKEGNHNLSIYGGIKLNDISSTRAAYPFYQPYSFKNFNFIKGKTVDLSDSLKVEYNSKIAPLQFNEDFESSGVSFINTSLSDTTLGKTSDSNIVFEGKYSGAIYLDDAKPTFEARTYQSFNISKNNQPVFVELNYKSNYPIVIGYFANTPTQSLQRDILFVNPSISWNKIYVNFTPAFNNEDVATTFNIFIGVYKQSDISSVQVFLDNIKLVHF